MPPSRRIIITLLSFLLPLSSLLATSQPNVIIILIDDLGWSDLGCYGSTFHETPHIDRLAASGVRFTNSYSANPVCSPSRAALLTGKAPQRIGITQWIHQPSDKHLPHTENTLAEVFLKAGYQTGYIGKWHLGEKDHQLPTSHGFSWMKATNRAGQPASFFHPYKRKSKRGSYWNVPDLENGKQGDYLTDGLTDHAINFIEQHKTNPFLLYLSHYAVHTPIQAPKQLIKKYHAKRKKLYGDSKTLRTPEARNTFSRGRQDHATYAAMIENLDHNIGRIIEKLRTLGIASNTLIILTSDNGGHCHLKRNPGVTCNLPLRSGKGWTYEGGIRIPTIITWPAKINPSINNTPNISMDIYPTLLDLTRQPLLPSQHLDGQSLVSAISGKPSPTLTSRALYWTYPHNHGSGHQPSHAIRKDDWKLIHFDTDNSSALYNLTSDPGEKHNLADKYPGKVKALHKELTNWITNTTPNPKSK